MERYLAVVLLAKPPNGWNCRCTTVQVCKDKYPTSDSAQAIARGAACTSKPKQQIFRFNPGKQLKIFPPKHPFLPKGCGTCELKMLEYDPNRVQCQVCKSLAECMKPINNLKEVYKQVLQWGKENIIGKYEYYNPVFEERKAIFVRNSFTENLRKGELFYAKIDVLNNIKSYLTKDLVFLRRKTDTRNCTKIL